MAEGNSQLVRDDPRDLPANVDADAVVPANVDAVRPEPTATAGGGGLLVVVTSVASDAHTWNLVFLQLTLEELGHRVRNLGACVPDELLVAECLRIRPDLVVVSSVNGHGLRDGTRLIGRIRACPELATTPVVIGGKLGIAGPAGHRARDQLRAAGFDGVFEADAGIDGLRSMTEQLTVTRAVKSTASLASLDRSDASSRPAGIRTNDQKVDHR